MKLPADLFLSRHVSIRISTIYIFCWTIRRKQIKHNGHPMNCRRGTGKSLVKNHRICFIFILQICQMRMVFSFEIYSRIDVFLMNSRNKKEFTNAREKGTIIIVGYASTTFNETFSLKCTKTFNSYLPHPKTHKKQFYKINNLKGGNGVK